MIQRPPKSWIPALCVLLAMASTARADPRGDLDRMLQHATPPGPGLDRAQVRPVPWCSNVRERNADWVIEVIDDLETYHRDRFAEDRIFHASRLLCNAPGDPVAQRAAAELEQLWINETGMAEPDALASLSLRADKDAFEAARTALCDAIRPKGDAFQGERHALATARYQLFGCRRDHPLWLRNDEVEHVGPLVDRGSAERDVLAHLAWVLFRQWKEQEEGEPDAILGYAVDQFDFHTVSADAAVHQLDAAPYRGNRYAKVILFESLGRARLITAKLEATVAKRAHDPTWKELLITAPDRGSAAWNAAAEHDKAALARSDEFDRKMQEGADARGCGAALRADFLVIMKKLKHDDVATLHAAMSDHPLAGLLLERLAHCMALDGDKKAAELMDNVLDKIRITTGPRVSAYFATLDAISTARDRSSDEVSQLARYLAVLEPRYIYEERPDNASGAVMGSVRRTGKTTHVTFAKVKTRVMQQSCRETSKIDRIAPDGKITYRQVCHDAGTAMLDLTPDPVDVPVAFASGLRAGGYATFFPLDTNGVSHAALPLAVYKDKTGKHLIAFYGFPLE